MRRGFRLAESACFAALAAGCAAWFVACGARDEIVVAEVEPSAARGVLGASEEALAIPEALPSEGSNARRGVGSSADGASRSVAVASQDPASTFSRVQIVATDERGRPLDSFRLFVGEPKGLVVVGSGGKSAQTALRDHPLLQAGTQGSLDLDVALPRDAKWPAWYGEAWVCALGYAPERVWLELTAGREWSTQCALSAIAPDVYGVVVDADGRARAGVELVLEGRPNEGCGPEGAFAREELSRETTVSAADGSFAFRIVHSEDAKRLVVDARKVTGLRLEPSELGPGMEVRLPRCASVAGRLADEHGGELGSVRLQFHRLDGDGSAWVEPALVTESDTFAFAEAPVGNVSLGVWRGVEPGRWSLVKEIPLLLVAGETRELDVEVPAFR